MTGQGGKPHENGSPLPTDPIQQAAEGVRGKSDAWLGDVPKAINCLSLHPGLPSMDVA